MKAATGNLTCDRKRGAALVVVMWVLLIVSLIVSSFAFEMQLEARIISARRKRFKADQLALAGIELVKTMLAFKEETPGDNLIYEDALLNKAVQLQEGTPVSYSEQLGDGTINVNVDYERGRRNLHKLSMDDWHELFDQAGIPNVEWDSLLGCLTDWEDENDTHQLSGAESDDFFYRQAGYECKNAPVDTIDELLLIKGWTPEILYGTPAEEVTEYQISGIARHLTTWGDGMINPNSASREVLNSLNIAVEIVDAILEARLGADGEEGTDDDGITAEDLVSLGLDTSLFTLTPEYITIVSQGTVGDLTSTISSVFKLGGREPSPLFWLEGEEDALSR